MRDILHDLGHYEQPINPTKLERMMEVAIGRIKSLTFVENDSVMKEEEETSDYQNMKEASIFKKPLYKQVTAREKQKQKN